MSYISDSSSLVTTDPNVLHLERCISIHLHSKILYGNLERVPRVLSSTYRP